MGNKKVTKKKAGNPSPKKAQGARKPRPVEPFRLEVGKTYETRNGRAKAKIEYMKPQSDWPAHGNWEGLTNEAWLNREVVPMWTESGAWILDGRKDEWDLVRQVPTAKRSPSRKARGS